MKNYYEILGVSENASDNDIKKCYRKLAMKFHPDRNKDKDAETKFKEINEAHEQLSDPDKRAAYDLSRKGGGFEHAFRYNQKNPSDNPFRNFHNSDIDLDELFGTFRKEQERRSQRQVFRLSLKDAYEGKIIQLGKENLRVPPGVRSGSKFYVNNSIVEIEILHHPKFKRSDDDLLVDVEIDSIEAILGIDAIITHINESQFQFKIPAGIQSGQIIRLGGKGMPNPETDRRGDLLIRCNVKTLKGLTDEQKEFLEKMRNRESITI